MHDSRITCLTALLSNSVCEATFGSLHKIVYNVHTLKCKQHSKKCKLSAGTIDNLLPLGPTLVSDVLLFTVDQMLHLTRLHGKVLGGWDVGCCGLAALNDRQYFSRLCRQ